MRGVYLRRPEGVYLRRPEGVYLRRPEGVYLRRVAFAERFLDTMRPCLFFFRSPRVRPPGVW